MSSLSLKQSVTHGMDLKAQMGHVHHNDCIEHQIEMILMISNHPT